MNPVSLDVTMAVCIVFILLVPLTAAGLALINSGLGRSRNAAHMMTAAMTVMSLAGLVYFVLGFGIQGHASLAGRATVIAGKPWSWLGSGPFFFRGLPFGEQTGGIGQLSLVAWLQLLSVGLAAIIPLGGGGGRWRFGSICASTAIFSALTYPIFAHWVWGGGWLAQLGTNCGLGRGFIDVGGSSVIQCSGGMTALSITWLLGPRRGKFGSDGMPSAIPGHNVVVVLFGCMLSLAGWIGLNEAGGLLFASTALRTCPMIAINTILSAASSLLSAVLLTRVRFGKPDASLAANGWVAGLVASSASCAFVQPAEAVVIGLLAGALVVYAIEVLELHLGIDDPGGSISVHGFGGLWGVLAMGLFGRFPAASGTLSSPELSSGGSGQLLAQLVGIATLLGFVFPLTFGVNWLLNRISPYRVASEGEWQGLDLAELGAGAYPEFVAHGDEFTPR